MALQLRPVRLTPEQERASDLAALRHAVTLVFHEHGYTFVRKQLDEKLSALAKANPAKLAAEGWIV